MILHTGWNDSAFNPKNWGGSAADNKSNRTTASNDNFDDSNEGYNNYSGSLANDLSMGLSTFGMSTEAQAEKLAADGWSPNAIQDYQNRTAASLAEALKEQERISSDDNNSSPTTTTTEDDTSTDDTTTTPTDDDDVGTSATNTTTLDTSSDGTSEPITTGITDTESDDDTETEAVGGTGTAAAGVAEAKQIVAQADGAAEAAVAETAKKGQRANILTTSQGLLSDEDDPNLRRRRSLMGGGLIN